MIFKYIIAIFLSAFFMMSLISCSVPDFDVNKDENEKIVKEYKKACEYAGKHADASIPNHADETYTESVKLKTEITAADARVFKKLNTGALTCEPVVSLDPVIEADEDVDAYLCKAIPMHTNGAEDPYWSLVTISEDSKKFEESIVLNIPNSVLQETVSNQTNSVYRNFGTWNFPQTYELSDELTECFNKAVDNDQNNGFTYTPLVKMGSVGFDSGIAYAVLALKEVKESDYKCFCVAYFEKNENGEVIFLNSSLIVY